MISKHIYFIDVHQVYFSSNEISIVVLLIFMDLPLENLLPIEIFLQNHVQNEIIFQIVSNSSKESLIFM